MTLAVNLYRKHSPAELVAMQEAIRNEPANKMPPRSLYLYVPKARKKLDAIAQAITFHLQDKREAEGRPVAADGYSGRQSNRR